MLFTQKFLEELLNKSETEIEGEKARVFTELYVDQFEDEHQWKLIFQYKEKFYQVPFVLCGGLRFNVNLADVNPDEINRFTEALRQKEEFSQKEPVKCLPAEDRTIVLSTKEAEKLLSEKVILYNGESIHLSGPLYTDDEDYATFSYQGDSYGFSEDLLDQQEPIACRTLPYIPALPFGVCAC